MLHLLYALALLLLLCGACAILAERFTLSPALLPLPVLSGAVVVLYLCGVAGFLRVGAVAVLLALAAVWVVGLVQYRPAGVADAWKKAASVPGFTLFLGGAAFIWVLFCVQQPMFTQWDEFTAWGLAPKMVVERGAFYVADPVNLKASFTYPATSLITFLFQPFGPWAEWACLAAIDTLALACLAAASALPRERWAGGVLVFAAGFLLPFFFSATPTGSYAAQYVNAMADLPLAMLFGGTLCLYFAVGRRKIAYWLVALPLAVLTLTKDICFAYGLIAVFLIGLDLWLAADEPCRKAFPKALLRAGALAVIVLAAFSSWGRYTAAVTPTADTAASVGSEGLSYGAVLVGGVKQLLGMGRTEKFAQIMAAMGSAFFTRRICLLGGGIMAVAAITMVAERHDGSSSGLFQMFAQCRVGLAVRQHHEAEFDELFSRLQCLYGVRQQVARVRMNLQFQPIGTESLACHLCREHRLFSVSYAGRVRKQLYAWMIDMLEHVVILVLKLYTFHCKSHHFGA